jgi:hypothetical protein
VIGNEVYFFLLSFSCILRSLVILLTQSRCFVCSVRWNLFCVLKLGLIWLQNQSLEISKGALTALSQFVVGSHAPVSWNSPLQNRPSCHGMRNLDFEFCHTASFSEKIHTNRREDASLTWRQMRTGLPQLVHCTSWIDCPFQLPQHSQFHSTDDE